MWEFLLTFALFAIFEFKNVFGGAVLDIQPADIEPIVLNYHSYKDEGNNKQFDKKFNEDCSDGSKRGLLNRRTLIAQVLNDFDQRQKSKIVDHLSTPNIEFFNTYKLSEKMRELQSTFPICKTLIVECGNLGNEAVSPYMNKKVLMIQVPNDNSRWFIVEPVPNGFIFYHCCGTGSDGQKKQVGKPIGFVAVNTANVYVWSTRLIDMSTNKVPSKTMKLLPDNIEDPFTAFISLGLSKEIGNLIAGAKPTENMLRYLRSKRLQVENELSKQKPSAPASGPSWKLVPLQGERAPGKSSNTRQSQSERSPSKGISQKTNPPARPNVGHGGPPVKGGPSVSRGSSGRGGSPEKGMPKGSQK